MNTPIRLLRRPAVENLVGLKRSAIYKLMAEARFPKPVSLSDGKNPPVAWIEAEILDFIQGRIAKRGQASVGG